MNESSQVFGYINEAKIKERFPIHFLSRIAKCQIPSFLADGFSRSEKKYMKKHLFPDHVDLTK